MKKRNDWDDINEQTFSKYKQIGIKQKRFYFFPNLVECTLNVPRVGMLDSTEERVRERGHHFKIVVTWQWGKEDWSEGEIGLSVETTEMFTFHQALPWNVRI